MQQKGFLPLIQELHSPFSPKTHKETSHFSAYSLDLNKFLPSLKLFKESEKNNISYYRDSFEKSLSLQRKSPKSVKKSSLCEKITKKHIKGAKSENLEKIEKKEDFSQCAFENSKEFTQKQEFHDNLQKIDRISAISVPLSKESFYDEYHMRLYHGYLNNMIAKKEEIQTLRENTRISIQNTRNSLSFFRIETNNNGFPLKILVNSNENEGDFVGFVSFLKKATKENHEFSFKESSFVIESEKLLVNDNVFITFFAVSKLKITISFYFIKKPTDLEKNLEKNSYKNHNNNPDKNHNNALENSEYYVKMGISSKKSPKNPEKFSVDFPHKSLFLISKNKILSANFLLQKSLRHQIKEESIIKRQKAIYNSDKLFFLETNDKIIKYLKKKTKNQELFYEKSEIASKANFLSFFSQWITIFSFIRLISSILELFIQRKTIVKINRIQGFFAIKIQKFIRKALNSKKIRYKSRFKIAISLGISLKTRFFYKNSKKKAQKILASFFFEIKRPFNIFLHFFKTLMRIIFLQNKIKHMRKSQIQMLAVLKKLWEDQVYRLTFSESQNTVFYLNKIPLSDKERILKEFLNKKKQEYFEEIQAFLKKKAGIDKRKSIVMKFLEKARKTKENDEKDDEITEMSQNSLFFRSVSPRKIMIKNVKNQMNFDEEIWNLRRKEEKSKTVICEKEKKEIEGRKRVEIKTLNEIDEKERGEWEKPLFRYIPRREEMREIILKTMEEVKIKEIFSTFK